MIIRNKGLYIFLSFLIIALFISFFTNHFSPFYPFNYAYDSNAYMSMARGWLSGQIPYRDIFDHKGPVLYIIYISGCLITDTSFTGMYIISSLFLATSLYFIYKIAHLFLSIRYAYIVPLIFMVIQAGLNTVDGSAEGLTLTLQIVFLYIVFIFFTNNEKGKEFRLLYLLGIFAGVIAFIKFNILLFCFFPLCAIILQLLLKKEILKAVKYTLTITAGILSIAIPLLLYFYLNDALNDFIEAYITFNKIYGNATIIQAIISIPIIFRLHIISNSLILFGIVLFLFKKNIIPNLLYRISIVLSLIATYLIIYCTPRTFDYSYLPISIFVIFFFIITLKYLEASKYNNHLARYCTYACLPICILLCGYMYRGKIKSKDKYYFAQEISDYIKSKNYNNKDLRILQIGLDQGLLNLTQSLPHYKYFYKPNIDQAQYPVIHNSFIKYINGNTPPQFIYYIKPLIMSNTEDTPLSPFEELIYSKYTLVKHHTDYSRWPTYNEYIFEIKN